MKHITYYLIASVIKLKGVKKIFSKAPIDYFKLRKDDIHSPKTSDVLGLKFHTIPLEKSLITEILPDENLSENIILYCHGGASVYGPTDLHWNSIAKIVKATNTKAYLADYPKAPEHKITEINQNIDAVYEYLLSKHETEKIILLGDSMGGTLLILLVQRLIKNGKVLPKSIVLLSPVLDCSMSNPKIGAIDNQDIMLSKIGVVSAKKMCAGNIDLQNPEISPLYGSFKNFIPTYIFTGENDIMRPDELLFVEKLKSHNIPVEVYEGKGMPHVWAFLPIMKEANAALKQMIEIVLKSPT
jgi:acetyl esterase/lipase